MWSQMPKWPSDVKEGPRRVVGHDVSETQSRLDLMTTAHEVSRHTVLMSTDDFRHNVLDVNGSLALLLSSGWSVIDDVAIVYSRMPGEPSQRQLLAMEMLQQELQGLNEGIRTHTVPFEADLPFVTEELTALLRLFESRDMVPSLETLHRWAYLWSFFRLLTAHTRSPQYERHLMTCRHYALFVADRVRGAYHSVPPCPICLCQCPISHLSEKNMKNNFVRQT